MPLRLSAERRCSEVWLTARADSNTYGSLGARSDRPAEVLPSSEAVPNRQRPAGCHFGSDGPGSNPGGGAAGAIVKPWMKIL